MTEKEKMLSGELYNSLDPELFDMRLEAKERVYEFNSLKPDKVEKRAKLLKGFLGKCGNSIYIEPPFRCDYGCYIEIGENFYSNYNLTILDCAKVKIGDNVLFGPNVSIYTAGHPLERDVRRSGLEYAYPITIGNDVWIGGNVVILPGVTIGDGAVIGAGSVVTKDIPPDVVAAGNPCRIIREI